MVNSRQKGKRIELALASLIKDYGWKARRTGFYQTQAGHDAADVECKDLPIHWECKGTERTQIRDWLSQACGDKRDDQMPVVAWKSKHRPWVGIMMLEDLFTILQHTDLEALSEALKLREVEGRGAGNSAVSEAEN